MQDFEKVVRVVLEAADEINREAGKVLVEQKPDAVLFGDQAKLDSLGLVNLIVHVEQIVERDFNKSISIADERAFSLRNSPFRTVQSLSEYISTLLEA